MATFLVLVWTITSKAQDICDCRKQDFITLLCLVRSPTLFTAYSSTLDFLKNRITILTLDVGEIVDFI